MMSGRGQWRVDDDDDDDDVADHSQFACRFLLAGR